MMPQYLTNTVTKPTVAAHAMDQGHLERFDHTSPGGQPMIDHPSSSLTQDHSWTVSSVLKRARQNLGWSLSDVAGILRIRLVQLQAIEDGRFDELPGPVYAVGFVRSYADLLDLDSDRIVRMFREEIAVKDERPELVFPSPVQDSGVPGGALLMLAIVLAVVSYAGWYYVASPNRDLADLVPALPERFAAMINGDETENSVSDVPTVPEDRVTAAASSVPPPAPIDADGAGLSEEPDGTAGLGEDVSALDGPTAADQSLRSAGGRIETARLEPRGARTPTPETVESVTLATGTPTPDTLQAVIGDPMSEDDPVSGAVEVVPDLPAALSGADTGLRRPQSVDAGAFDEPLPRRIHDATTAEAATPAEPVTETEPDAAFAGDPGRTSVASLSAFDDLPLPPQAGGAGDAAHADAHEPRIIIQAVADSWVQVNDSDGLLVMTRTLRPGDRYEVPEDEGLRLVTGNAGGLEIFVDGQAVPALGASGVVLRNVPLDANRLQSGTATPN